MVKILSLLLPSLSMVVSGVSSVGSYNHEQQRSNVRSHVVEYDNYEVTYKYETNEVNSINDLIHGNVYNFKVESEEQLQVIHLYGQIVNVNYFYVSSYESAYLDEFYTENDVINDLNVGFDFSSDGNGYYTIGVISPVDGIDYFANYVEFYSDINFKIDFDFVFDYTFETSGTGYFGISSSSYNIIESVQPISYNSSVLGYIYDFIYNDILTIPHIDDFTYNVMGQTISLHRYLAITICIILACLLIFLLVWFIRYLFRLFSGLLH